MAIHIRSVEEKDHEELTELFYEVFGPEGLQEDWSKESSRLFIKENTWNKEFTFCAEKDGALVGLIVAFPSVREPGPGVYIHVIAVKNSMQHSGIGTALWNKVIDVAKEKKFNNISLSSNPKYNSYKWYKSMGLVESGYIDLVGPLEKI